MKPRIRWDLDAFVDGQLVARERYRLSPDDASLEALRLKYPRAHYVSCVVLSSAAPPLAEIERPSKRSAPTASAHVPSLGHHR